MTEFIVKTATAKMPTSVKHPYARVAVLEIEHGAQPKMISDRARGVVRVVRTWEKLSVGKTERCAFRRALRLTSCETD